MADQRIRTRTTSSMNKRAIIRFLAVYGAATIVTIICLVPLCLVVAVLLSRLWKFIT
jgi:hypothetical protein